MKTVSIKINGQTIITKPGTSILAAALDSGIYIPNLCYHHNLNPLPQVSPDLSCQLCLVDIDGQIKLSCDTEVIDSMVVNTETDTIKEIRRRMITDILRRHPNACLSCWRKEHCGPADTCFRSVALTERCVLCPSNKRCELQRAAEHIGINELTPTIEKQLPVREDSPFFIRDNNLCINCRKCVRVCADIRKANVLEFAYPCHKACPAGIDIPRYIKAIAKNRPSTALAVIREKVPFPGVLGRVCIHPCEAECQRGKIQGNPLQIRMLKRFAADHGNDSWRYLSKKISPTGKKVAVIGAGPAGLTAAYYLAKSGHSVTVFEAQPKPGGMLLLGIPEYRLPRQVLENEIQEITNVGVTILTNSPVKSIDPLFSEGYEAVFIGLGAHQGMRLGVDGDSLTGVMESVEFLRRGNLGEKIVVGERVGVVGGGNVAIDAARMALRLGAQEVTIFYRRTRAEMPAAPEEVEAAQAEGVKLEFLTAPAKVIRENGALTYFCTRMKLGEPDASGRPRPVPIENSEFGTKLDMLLVAIGQRPDIPSEMKIETGRGNTITVDETMMTKLPGVFSAGDCVSGPASVIEAIAGGRKAAEAIDKYLGGEGDISDTLVCSEGESAYLNEVTFTEKLANTKHLEPAKSVQSFAEVEHGWEEETAISEAQRCLRCYVIAPNDDKSIQDANCKFCGACVDTCPTGALIERSSIFSGPMQGTTMTTCPYCGVGCQIEIEVKNNNIVSGHPVNGLVNKGQACIKGKFGLDFISHPDRLKVPLNKKEGKFIKTTWDEALNHVASTLARFKPEEIAIIASAKNTNEDNFVLQKFARTVLGTNNIDNCARLCYAPSIKSLEISFGSGAMTNPIQDLSKANCVFAIGTNTIDAHPVISIEIQQAISNGSKLIVANPLKISLIDSATLWLKNKPGTDYALLMGMAKIIIEEGLADHEFINNRCENYEVFKESLKHFDLESVSHITEVPADDIIRAAKIYATRKPSTIIYATGITQHPRGTDNVSAIANLAMLTGNIGKPSTGVNPLAGQNNMQGTCDMGALPDFYPGYQSIVDPVMRKKFEDAWGYELNPQQGLTLSDVFEAIHQGKVKALYLVGENPVLSQPGTKYIKEALHKLEFFAFQDIFLNETGEFAHTVLPATSFAEKEGTFTNTERRVQRVRQVVDRIGDTRPDWWITSEIARRMGGHGFNYKSAADIMAEINALIPSYRGITYDRLESESLQWPCLTTEHPGTPILHTNIFTRGKGQFIPLSNEASSELPNEEYPLMLMTSRMQTHYGTGTMTRRVHSFDQLNGEWAEINSKDAVLLGIAQDDVVIVTSRRGEVKTRARITDTVPTGLVNMSFHFSESPVDAVTSSYSDTASKIPELKVCAVNIRKI